MQVHTKKRKYTRKWLWTKNEVKSNRSTCRNRKVSFPALYEILQMGWIMGLCARTIMNSLEKFWQYVVGLWAQLKTKYSNNLSTGTLTLGFVCQLLHAFRFIIHVSVAQTQVRDGASNCGLTQSTVVVLWAPQPPLPPPTAPARLLLSPSFMLPQQASGNWQLDV